MSVLQTSPEGYGQIYVPIVNWAMMVITIALVISFDMSSRLAGAYGTAVSTTMLLTTVLLYYAMRHIWRWRLRVVLPLAAVFVVVDFVFLAATF